MYDKQGLIQDILIDLNEIATTILAGQNGNKPPMPYAAVNIISENLVHENEEIEYIPGVDDVTTIRKNNTELTLSITHHSKDNLDDEVNLLLDYFRSTFTQLENKYSCSIINEPAITNRNTILNVEFDNRKGFDVVIYIDDVVETTETYIEEVEL